MSVNVPFAFSSAANGIYDSVQSSNNNQGTVQASQPSNPATKQNQSSSSPSFGVMMYPAGLLQKQSDYFQIKSIQYTPPNKGGDITNSFYQIQTQDKLRNETSKGMVILPMPAKVIDISGANWGEGILNPVQALPVKAFGTLSNPAQAADNTLNAFKDKLTNPSSAFDEAASVLGYGAAYATSKAVSAVNINLDPNELLARTQGTISNPNGELLFKGPRLRSYSFTYRMVPRNRFEANIIRKIVRFFKQSMLPTKSGILLNTPYVFFLEYKRKQNGSVKALNKFKPCALTDFNVDNSAGEGWNSYYDETDDVAQPIATTIQLTFTELTPIFREDYDEFKSLDDVGY